MFASLLGSSLSHLVYEKQVIFIGGVHMPQGSSIYCDISISFAHMQCAKSVSHEREVSSKSVTVRMVST